MNEEQREATRGVLRGLKAWAAGKNRSHFGDATNLNLAFAALSHVVFDDADLVSCLETVASDPFVTLDQEEHFDRLCRQLKHLGVANRDMTGLRNLPVVKIASWQPEDLADHLEDRSVRFRVEIALADDQFGWKEKRIAKRRILDDFRRDTVAVALIWFTRKHTLGHKFACYLGPSALPNGVETLPSTAPGT